MPEKKTALGFDEMELPPQSGTPAPVRPETDHPYSPSGFYAKSQERRAADPARRNSSIIPAPSRESIPPGISPREDASGNIFVPYRKLQDFLPDFLHEHPGEPFYFLDRGSLREKAGILHDHFLPGDPRRAIAYAVKANPRKTVLQTLREEGIGHFDCASLQEIERINSLDGTAGIFFNNPVKPLSSVERAAEMGVRHFTVQTQRAAQQIYEMAMPLAKGEPVEIVARLKTENNQADINLSSKFGARAQDVVCMVKAVRQMIGAIPGIAIHAGSQNRDKNSFERAIKFMAEVGEVAGGVNIFNVGGGIPANRTSNDRYDFREYVDVITRAVNTHINRVIGLGGRGENQMIAIELGRSIVADAVDLVVPVLAVEQRGIPAVYFDDGIFTSFSDAAIHGWKYNFRSMKKTGEPGAARKKRFTLYGRTCDSGDTLGEVMLPEDIEEGDYVWVRGAGAYMDAQASSFHDFAPPRYVIYN